MGGVSTFLESSSIHGFFHIATNRTYARLFWILVVCFGFLGAVFLINSSFETWNESPVNTIFETLSIKRIGFPKVAVCPLRNTYTTLNFDIMNANHTSRLDETILSLLIKTTVSKMHELETDVATANFLEDKKRFRNWYFGFDVCFKKFPGRHLQLTSYLIEVSFVMNEYKIIFLIKKGHVLTPHYNEAFNQSTFSWFYEYKLGR